MKCCCDTAHELSHLIITRYRQTGFPFLPFKYFLLCISEDRKKESARTDIDGRQLNPPAHLTLDFSILRYRSRSSVEASLPFRGGKVPTEYFYSGHRATNLQCCAPCCSLRVWHYSCYYKQPWLVVSLRRHCPGSHLSSSSPFSSSSAIRRYPSHSFNSLLAF